MRHEYVVSCACTETIEEELATFLPLRSTTGLSFSHLMRFTTGRLEVFIKMTAEAVVTRCRSTSKAASMKSRPLAMYFGLPPVSRTN